MQSLTERLYNHNVLFSYYGFIDNSVLEQVLRITRNKLENGKESEEVINRVHDAINDCVENIIEHNFFPGNEILNYKSLLVVSSHNQSYFIDTINVVNAAQKQSINEQLTELNSKNKQELQALKEQIILKNENRADGEGSGLGLIDLLLGTDNCNYRFKDYESNFLFNINFEIASLSQLVPQEG